jgi:hypothetical protein
MRSRTRPGTPCWARSWGGPETASGLVQILAHHRVWLLLGVLGLVVAAIGLAVPPGKAQGRWFLAGGVLGFGGLLASGFMIGAKGWSFEILNRGFGELALNQFGIGIGAFVALLALVMIAAFGVARLGFFKGDLFVASAVVGCSVLLLLFIAFPVVKALHGRLPQRAGAVVLAGAAGAHRQRAGLGAELPGGRAALWRGLEHAVLGRVHRHRHHRAGTMMALMAERSASARVQTPLRVVALLPIITPPFVVGLGPDPAVRPCRRGEPVPRICLRHPAHALVLRGAGHLDRPDVRLHADCLHDHARCGAGRGAQPGRGGADAARRPPPHLLHHHAALAQTRPGQCLPGGLHREHGGLRQPDRGGRAVFGAVHRHLLCHRRRPVRPGARGIAGLDPHAVRAGRLCPAARLARQAELHHRQRQGRRRHPHGAARQCAPRAERRGLPVAGLHRGGLPVRVCRWLRADLGARLHAHAQPFQDRLCAGVGPVRPRLGRHGLELPLHHRQAGRAVGAGHRRHRPADRLAAGAHRVSRARACSSSWRCWRSRSQAPCWA